MGFRNIAILSLTVGSLLSVSNVAAEDSMKNTFIQSSNEFAFELYREFSAKEGNVLFSPLSVSGAMALVYAGATGETASALADMLGIESAESLLSDFKRIRERLVGEAESGTARTSEDNPNARTMPLRLATGLWFAESIQISKSYRRQIENSFNSTLGRIDAKAPEASLKEINAWVAERTEGKIKDLFSPGSIQSSTPLVLANAVYFKGDWARPFEKTESFPAQFAVGEEASTEVVFMNKTDRLRYAESDQAKLIELPFADEKLVFVAVLPRSSTPKNLGSFGSFEQGFGPEALQKLYSAADTRLGNLALPRFRLEHSPELQSALLKLGAAVAFSPAADFSKMTERKTSLHIAEAVHKAVIEVNEEGSEAAAATGIVTTTGLPTAEKPFEFRADRPFLFFILDKESGLILFFGRVSDPSSGY